MVAASVWSLLIPAIDMAENTGILPWIPSVTGFMAGVLFLRIIDILIPLINKYDGEKKTHHQLLLFLSVTLHNIPEGMAVGVVFAGMLAADSAAAYAGALSLAVGIAIQNLPEGAIISLPLKSGGMNRSKAFACGVFSGIVEPIAAFFTIFLIAFVQPILPYVLSFAAGAMIAVATEELIPESQSDKNSPLATFATAIGFAFMMMLDITLG